MEGAADSICEPLKYGSQCAITSEVDSQTGYKIQDLGTLSTPRIHNGMLYYERRHPLLLEYSITFLRYISEMEGPSDSIYTPLMARTLSFLPMLTPKFDTKYKISGPLSSPQCYDVL